MKKVMVGVGLGLAAVSQAHAWNPGVQSVQSAQNVQATGVASSHSSTVAQSRSAGMAHCRLPANRTHGQTHQCTPTSGQSVQQRAVTTQRQAPQQQRNHHRNQQQALQTQRAQRQAMFAAQAKRKAQLLAQQRKRAAMLEQQKRRKMQLAQQQQRAAHQAAMLAAKKKRAALLIQQKRRAMQLAQQRRQQAQKRAALMAQQKRRQVLKLQQQQRQASSTVRTAAQPRRVMQQPRRVVQQPRPMVVQQPRRVVQQPRPRVAQPQIQPRVTFSQQVVTQREVASNFRPQEEIISRRIITTYVTPEQLANTPAPVSVQQAPRVSASQGLFQQSVDHHDYQSSRRGWLGSQNIGAQPVQQIQQPLVSPAQQSVAHHEARVKRQRLQQIRAAQIAAQQQRQHQQHQQRVQKSAAVQVAPVAPTQAQTVASSQSVANHSGGWQRQANVHSHQGNAYAMYQG